MYSKQWKITSRREDNKSELVDLLEEYIDFEAIIPPQFQYAYYNRYGRKRINSLESFIRALILKSLFRNEAE